MMNPNIETLTEDEIVARLKSGEIGSEAAYDILYTTLYPFLHQVARHYRHVDAEDVVFDTLAQLPSLLESYKGKGSLRRYLMAVLRNRIISNYRHFSRNRKIEEIESIHEDELIKATTVPSNVESTQLVRELFEKLTEEERLIVTARVIDGAKIEEIAKMLHSSNSTVHRKLLHAMTKLRKLLGEKGTAQDA